MTLELPDGFVPHLPNCGVVALAIATGKPYDTIWNWFAQFQKRPGAWRGRTYRKNYLACLHQHGKRRSTRGSDGRGLTVQRWAALHTVKGVMYLVHVHGHLMVLKDGIVIDNVRPATPVADSHSRRCRVTDWWRVED